MILGNQNNAGPNAKPMPAYAVAFFQDGFGNAYFFDTRSKRDDGEYAVLFWDHDDPLEGDEYKLTKTDDNFAGWFERYIHEVITPRVNRLVRPASLAVFAFISLVLVLAVIAGIILLIRN